MKKQGTKKTVILLTTVLLVVLMCAIGTATFARFITTGTTGTKTATVAKWGYTVTVNADNLLGANYQDGSVQASSAGADVVSASASANVVAPGTEGNVTFTVAGSSEVLAKIEFDGALTSDVTLQADGESDVYAPIKWSYTIDESRVECADFADLLAKLNALGDNILEANAASVNKVIKISWAWALDGGNDVYDTVLGQETTPSGYAVNRSFSFNIDAAVKQIQDNER